MGTDFKGFTYRTFNEVIAQWWDYRESGIPPTREYLGRNGQNPRLLQAFAALDRAKQRARQAEHAARKAALEAHSP